VTHLVLDAVSLTYRRPVDDGELLALDDINLVVERGELVTIVGPSGAGKSSLLQLVNGLLRPTSGQVLINGRRVDGPVPECALVFQESGLLPWRNVLQNVELGLELRRRPSAERRNRARQSLRLVGLEAFERYYPHQLSGGMRQRVGLARALSVDPEILLMDEPFGALDAQMRQLMATELLSIWERDRKTILFVTHDVDESIFLADRVVVMSASPGRVLELLPIDLPRPRTIDVRHSPELVAYRRTIWHLLEGELQAALARQLGGEERERAYLR